MSQSLTWWPATCAVVRAWRPLLAFELAISLASAIIVGPLLALATYQAIGFSGEAFLGNWELLRFLLSPPGLLALVLLVGTTLGVVLVEYSGLILLSVAAIRGKSLPLSTLLRRVLWSSPRLCGLGLVCVGLTVAVALPLLAIGAGSYWLLLSDADINFFLVERPPRFWAAVAIAVLLGGILLAWATWLLAQWALTVPLCAVESLPLQAVFGHSRRLMRGRSLRLLIVILAWQAIRFIAFFLTLALLERANHSLLGRFAENLTTLVWLAGALLLVEAILLDLLAAAFAILLAALVAIEFEQAREAHPELQLPGAENVGEARPPGQLLRVATLALVCAGPLLGLAAVPLLAKEFIEHRAVLVTAHRAGPKTAAENSLAALELSIAAGADMVEIDVQQTADGTVVLMHDRDLRRMTGDARDVSQVTLADLRELRLRAGEGPTDEPVPTLAEFLDRCAGKVRVNVELKDFGHSENLGTATVDVLRAQGAVDASVVSSLEMAPLVQVRQAAPDLPIGLILAAGQGDWTRLPVDFLSLHQRLVRSDLVRRAHQRGMQVHAWGVSDRETALRMLDLGCDNLITDNPALMRETVDWYANLGDIQRMLLRLRRWMRE